MQCEASYMQSMIGADKYLTLSQDWMLICVKAHETKKKLCSIIKKAKDYSKELNLPTEKDDASLNPTAAAKAAKIKAKKLLLSRLQQNWSQKALHGKFYNRANDADVDTEKTYSWLASSSLKAETEGFLLAAQDQSLKTRNYMKYIMKKEVNPNCRYCNQEKETIDHIVSGCTLLARKDYIERHNRVATYVHWNLCRHFNFVTSPQWYKHEVQQVVENNMVTIMWDFPVQTDRTIRANRPDIIIRDKREKTCYLLDVSIPTDKNTSLKTFEKISKYKDLEIEIERSWKEKTKTVPIVVGALGVINKSTENYLKVLPTEISIKEIQKIALLGTATILRKALSMHTV